MTLEEQDAFFQKELKAIQKYFKDIIILSAVVHRDEVFHPIDEDMKALFPDGKITPHMHITTIPIVHDKKSDCKKISISELWKGRNSYRKFQDYMYKSVGKEYGFDRGETHDFGEATKHLEVEAFKLQEASKSLAKLESAIIEKEQEISERAKILEPEEHISILNLKKVVEQEIKRVNPDSEYLLIRGSRPLSTVTFNRRIKKCCLELGIEYRSSHKVRFSTSSILHKNGTTNTELQEQLGHTTLTMTNGYLKNITPRSETYAKINRILD